MSHCHSHLAAEETEAWSNDGTDPRSHTKNRGLGFEFRFSHTLRYTALSTNEMVKEKLSVFFLFFFLLPSFLYWHKNIEKSVYFC